MRETSGAEAYRKTVLPNGVRVVTESLPWVRSVAVGIWVETGSRVEPLERGGISHLIEHLVFKGTETRSAEDIARSIDSVGGHMDAFTAKEHTCFYVNVLDQHLEMAADLLSDVLLRPRFDPGDIEKEKAVVFQEMKMVDDTPDDLVHDLFAEKAWPGHPLGRPILGRREVIEALERGTILEHFHGEYAPARVTVAVAGHAEHDQVVDAFATRFERFLRPALPHAAVAPTLTPGVHLISKPLEQVQVVLGFPGISDTSPERYALYLMNDIMGGSMSSRIFQEVRERQGLVYAVHSGAQQFHDSGVLYLYAGTETGNFGRVLKAFLREVRALRKDGVTPEELARAKDHLKGNLMLSLESSSSRMNRLAKQELRFGAFHSVDEMLAQIDGVRSDEIDALIQRLLDEEQLCLVTLGPVTKRDLPTEMLA